MAEITKKISTKYFRIVVVGIFLVGMFLSPNALQARTNVTDWYIQDFQSEITVNKDASLDITERITADCGTAMGKHGIFRVLPLKYKTTNETFLLPIDVISVTDFNNNKINYEVSKSKEALTIKIGSADRIVYGVNNYIIKYHVKNTIRTGNAQFDELYWNLSGNFWDIEIDNFTAKVIFPKEINQSNTEVNYYIGALNSSNLDTENFYWLSDNIIEFSNHRTMKLGDGVTASVTFPKKIITPATLTLAEKGIYDIIFPMMAFLIPLLVFIFSFRIWRKYGQDPKLNKTIIPEFEIPENLSPMEMGGVMRTGNFSNQFITASIIQLAVLGYLKIEEVTSDVLFIKTTDYKFIRTEKEVTNDLCQSEALLLNKIFMGGKKEILVSELKDEFSLQIPKIAKSLKEDLQARGLVAKRDIYSTVMIIASIVFAIFGFMLLSSWQLGISLLLSAVIVLVLGLLMPQRSLAGAELNWRISGFKLYMETAEKYRAQFNEKENIMEKFLPYAILFDMTKEWLKKMKDIYGDESFVQHQPAFLSSANGLSDIDSFTKSLDNVTKSISSHVSSSSSGSRGGGSSGGGGGGGGGGGW